MGGEEWTKTVTTATPFDLGCAEPDFIGFELATK